jgi:UDP-N-acetylmuramyl pentapeptide phosphotransferase/UDP-N-acetylglucosamine-1-phosphate transferase
LPAIAGVAKQARHPDIACLTDLSPSARFASAVVAFVAAFLLGGPAGLGAAAMAAALTALGMPLFRRYAMARPNARSSHVTPVPQGGGAAVVAATLAATSFGLLDFGLQGAERFAWIAAGAVLLAAVGAVDDIRGVPVLPRLGLQLLAVAAVVALGSSGARLLPEPVPYAVEFVLLTIAGAWFVNLTNFMDGIDGITLAGFMPLAAAVVALGWLGRTTALSHLLALCFFGAMAGFLWFNTPRARLFLGDVGSLPIGLVGGALLLDLAQNGAFAAAVILPLYHFTDATMTLVKRIVRREKVWIAHRQHAYQAAVDGGWPHAGVSGMVLVLNVCLALLAVASTQLAPPGQIACVAAAVAAVLGLFAVFRARAPRP